MWLSNCPTFPFRRPKICSPSNQTFDLRCVSFRAGFLGGDSLCATAATKPPHFAMNSSRDNCSAWRVASGGAPRHIMAATNCD